MNILKTRAAVALAAASTGGGALASAHIVDIAWSSDGRFAHHAPLAPGKFVELCGKLAAGSSPRWRFTAAAPVDFNIHYHVGKQAVYPVKPAQVADGSDTLNVTVAQDHCWMWTNKGASPMGLAVELVR